MWVLSGSTLHLKRVQKSVGPIWINTLSKEGTEKETMSAVSLLGRKLKFQLKKIDLLCGRGIVGGWMWLCDGVN